MTLLLQAKARLKALLNHPARNDSQRGFILSLANMVNGRAKIIYTSDSDCKANTAYWIVHHPNEEAYICLIGERGSDRVVHVMIASDDGKKIFDVFKNGRLNGAHYDWNLPSGPVEGAVLRAVRLKTFMHYIAADEQARDKWILTFPN